MAVPWIAVLQKVPWRDVIVNAPKVADEARKFWTTIKREPAGAATVEPADVATEKNESSADETPQVIKLKQKTAQLATDVEDLREQLVESSTLIKALADQNELLVKHIEINRSRVKLLSIVLGLSVVCVVLAILRMQAVI